ncbi:MAG: hypothetical protein HY073_04000 [Deltaproteobacteria bacterium]|nr:hypothetical protein [Deltaproteobacteria bacterium]
MRAHAFSPYTQLFLQIADIWVMKQYNSWQVNSGLLARMILLQIGVGHQSTDKVGLIVEALGGVGLPRGLQMTAAHALSGRYVRRDELTRLVGSLSSIDLGVIRRNLIVNANQNVVARVRRDCKTTRNLLLRTVSMVCYRDRLFNTAGTCMDKRVLRTRVCGTATTILGYLLRQADFPVEKFESDPANHAILILRSPVDGKRIIIDPTFRQFTPGSEMKNYPLSDILVIHEDQLEQLFARFCELREWAIRSIFPASMVGWTDTCPREELMNYFRRIWNLETYYKSKTAPVEERIKVASKIAAGSPDDPILPVWRDVIDMLTSEAR